MGSHKTQHEAGGPRRVPRSPGAKMAEAGRQADLQRSLGSVPQRSPMRRCRAGPFATILAAAAVPPPVTEAWCRGGGMLGHAEPGRAEAGRRQLLHSHPGHCRPSAEESFLSPAFPWPPARSLPLPPAGAEPSAEGRGLRALPAAAPAGAERSGAGRGGQRGPARPSRAALPGPSQTHRQAARRRSHGLAFLIFKILHVFTFFFFFRHFRRRPRGGAALTGSAAVGKSRCRYPQRRRSPGMGSGGVPAA